jgi:hypothetical protein
VAPFVERMLAPRWRGRGCDEHELERPSWDDVEAAIRRLDQGEHNDLYLVNGEGAGDTFEGATVLGIWGGAGSYYVSVSGPGVLDACATSPERSPDVTQQVVGGGQRVGFPSDEVVDLATALAAARAFFADGSLAKGLHWRDE